MARRLVLGGRPATPRLRGAASTLTLPDSIWCLHLTIIAPGNPIPKLSSFPPTLYTARPSLKSTAVRCQQPKRRHLGRRAASSCGVCSRSPPATHCAPSVVETWSHIADRRSDTGMQGQGKQEITEKACRPLALSGTIPMYENPGAAQLGIEPHPPWWEGSSRGNQVYGMTHNPDRQQVDSMTHHAALQHIALAAAKRTLRKQNIGNVGIAVVTLQAPLKGASTNEWSGEIWAAVNIEILIADEGEVRYRPFTVNAGVKGREKQEITSSIVRHDSCTRKSVIGQQSMVTCFQYGRRTIGMIEQEQHRRSEPPTAPAPNTNTHTTLAGARLETAPVSVEARSSPALQEHSLLSCSSPVHSSSRPLSLPLSSFSRLIGVTTIITCENPGAHKANQVRFPPESLPDSHEVKEALRTDEGGVSRLWHRGWWLGSRPPPCISPILCRRNKCLCSIRLTVCGMWMKYCGNREMPSTMRKIEKPFPAAILEANLLLRHSCAVPSACCRDHQRLLGDDWGEQAAVCRDLGSRFVTMGKNNIAVIIVEQLGCWTDIFTTLALLVEFEHLGCMLIRRHRTNLTLQAFSMSGSVALAHHLGGFVYQCQTDSATSKMADWIDRAGSSLATSRQHRRPSPPVGWDFVIGTHTAAILSVSSI
ncbi:hypothetical protein PR048_024605 [Dryococelus australis]|uniref:Uncharacterized protein n=1 Tax=Dryococelus australis TaxID=614101 RepID=A0ABQ9GP43_9NEOP|nr:hypothetical protein PR048_024605 [Dryococelus australis]